MGRVNKILFVLFIICAVVLAAFFIIGFLKPKSAGLFIEADPQAIVYINGVEKGRTPFETTFPPGDTVIKMIPDSFEKPLMPYEVKVSLVSGIQTIIQREFGETNEKSSGVIVSYEKSAGKETSLAVVTIPDGAQVLIDGQPRDYAPYLTNSVTVGEHVLSVTAPKYKEKSLLVQTREGYKLTAAFQLKPSDEVLGEETSMATPTMTPEPKPIIEILDTPTGFLRVRAEASTLADEVAQVKPGEKYILLSEDEKTGWYQIDLSGLEEAKETKGWISNKYARKIEGELIEVTPKPTATISATPTSKPATSSTKPIDQ